MNYCRRCILPDTRPNLRLGPDGVCDACRRHAERPQVDWAARARAFAALVDPIRRRSHGYDCVVPVSGGKDSTWQVVTCLEAGLRPLAVSWRPPARTDLGRRNLENLISLGVDHIDYSISPRVEKLMALRALERFGSPAIPMHLAIFAIPAAVAVRFRIPLVVWGENSAAEYGGTDEEAGAMRLDEAWVARFGVTQGTGAADWVGEGLSAKDLAVYFGPGDAERAAAGVEAVFLGQFFPYDPETSLRVARAHGFAERAEGPRTGTYAFADLDDEFISIHHWLKWYKFGFTRSFDTLSSEIRHGRLTRAGAIDALRARGDETPRADIERFCAFVEIAPARFWEIAEHFRNRKVWSRRDGVWRIDGFLIADWTWT
jgi:N-acetyl sugar amidotransferase